MKIIFTILSFILLITSCGSGGTSTAPKTATKAISESYIITDSSAITDTIDLGRMHDGEIAGRSIELCNATSSPIIILSVELSCGCTTVDFDKQPIQPSKCTTLSFEFNSKGFKGFQMKNITIKTSASPKPNKIVLLSEVE